MMKKSVFPFLMCFCSLLNARAQELYFPMEPVDGKVTEQVTGSTWDVQGVHTFPGVSGVVGKALRLDGYSNYVTSGLNYSRLNGTSMTFSLWCAAESYPMMNANEAETTPTYTMIAGNLDDGAKTGFALMLNSQGGYQFKCYLKSWQLICVAKDVLPLGEWNHLAVTVDKVSNKILLYRNGVQVGQAKCPYELTVGTAQWMMGKGRETLMGGLFHLNTFNGLLDEVQVWNRVLSEAEIAAIQTTVKPDLSVPTEAWENDLLRPQFHGMPSHGWTNECHGMVMSDGQYHLFFQKNGNGPYMARLHWGHLVSNDLLTWEEVPAALAPSEAYDMKGCWSGCVMQDGLVTDGEPWLVYTGVDNAKATIDAARPVDETLAKWTKDEGNPLINGRPSGLSDDFRDPYFFRTNEGAFLVVGSGKGGVGTCTLHKYDAATKTWSNTGDLFYTGLSAAQYGTFWEMPNVTKMGDKWLVTVTPQGLNGGVKTIYFVGNIDAKGHFVPDSSTPLSVELSGVAKEGYGMLSPTICQLANGKTVALGIVPDKLPTEENYKMGYAHCYSLPREWSLTTNGTLVQKPYEGLKALRMAGGTIAEGRQVEVLVDFTVGSGDVGVSVLKHGDNAAKIYYHPADNSLCVDLTSLERMVNDAGVFDGIYKSVLPRTMRQGEKMTLNVFVDGSVLDIFVNEEWATSVRVFCTDAEAKGVELLNEGEVGGVTFQAWNLDAQTATGMDGVGVAAGEREVSKGIFDLGGRRHAKAERGIYIVDGKTVRFE